MPQRGPLTSEEDHRFRTGALPWMEDVTRYATWLTRDPVEASDLTQETYLRAYRGWRSFREGDSCRPWLLAICRNTYFSSRNRGQRVVAVDDAELESLAAAQVHRTAQEQGQQHLFDLVDVGDAVAEALGRLSDEFREAVVLVDIQDLSYAEASRVLDVPPGTLRSRLFRARRLLQEDLMAYARDAGFATATRPDSEFKGGSDGT